MSGGSGGSVGAGGSVTVAVGRGRRVRVGAGAGGSDGGATAEGGAGTEGAAELPLVEVPGDATAVASVTEMAITAGTLAVPSARYAVTASACTPTTVGVQCSSADTLG